MRHGHLPNLIMIAALCVFLTACSGDNKAPAAPAASSSQPAAQEESTADEPSVRTENAAENTDAPVIESEDLTRFRLAFGDPELSDPASGNGVAENALNTATWSFTLASSDLRNPDAPVSCQMSYRLYTEPEDADDHTVSFDADASDLTALQDLIAESGMIARYCNFDDETDAGRDYAFSRMTFEYASDESAWHYCNTDCDIASADRLAVCSFFYGLLEKYNIRFYYHPVDYASEEAFLEAFLGQAAWNDLSVTGKDGEQIVLSLTSDATGRIFRLAAGEDVYAGNYKLKSRQDDGRWRLDFTLTTWPAEYTPMTKGGSILIDTEISPPQANGGGTETLLITKFQNQTSIFDPFYGEEGVLSFVRKRTEYFNEKELSAAE